MEISKEGFAFPPAYLMAQNMIWLKKTILNPPIFKLLE
jgi:hypothetical protein